MVLLWHDSKLLFQMIPFGSSPINQLNGTAQLTCYALRRGIVKEKEAAKKEYQAAVSAGRQAALLEQDAGDVFTCTIGNLKANERVTVRITTIGEIKMVNGITQFVLPMVVAPVPGSHTQTGWYTFLFIFNHAHV
jgi:hypothetical protein